MDTFQFAKPLAFPPKFQAVRFGIDSVDRVFEKDEFAPYGGLVPVKAKFSGGVALDATWSLQCERTNRFVDGVRFCFGQTAGPQLVDLLSGCYGKPAWSDPKAAVSKQAWTDKAGGAWFDKPEAPELRLLVRSTKDGRFVEMSKVQPLKVWLSVVSDVLNGKPALPLPGMTRSAVLKEFAEHLYDPGVAENLRWLRLENGSLDIAVDLDFTKNKVTQVHAQADVRCLPSKVVRDQLNQILGEHGHNLASKQTEVEVAGRHSCLVYNDANAMRIVVT